MTSYLDPEGHPDALAILAPHWPADGPYSPESVAAAALALDELARTTRPTTHTLSRGADLYRLLKELHSTASRLDQVLAQVLAQATTAAARLRADPTLYDDRRDGHSPAATAGERKEPHRAPRFHLGAVIAPLAAAHAATSHLAPQRVRNPPTRRPVA